MFSDILYLRGDRMADFEAEYYKLFAAAADTVDALDHWNPGQAREILIRAQQQAENAILRGSETGEAD